MLTIPMQGGPGPVVSLKFETKQQLGAMATMECNGGVTPQGTQGMQGGSGGDYKATGRHEDPINPEARGGSEVYSKG